MIVKGRQEIDKEKTDEEKGVYNVVDLLDVGLAESMHHEDKNDTSTNSMIVDTEIFDKDINK